MKISQFNRLAINFLKKSQVARQLHGKYHKYEEAFPRKNLFDDTTVTSIRSDSKLFFANGKSYAEETGNVDEKVPSLLGWVPYIKNRTSIVVYHFFSVNYALRKQVLIRVSLVKKLKVAKVVKFWLPSGFVHEYDLREIARDIDADSVFIELFHPKLPKNHGGHDGHLRAWGKYYNHEGHYISTVHTAPLEKNNGFSAKRVNARTYFPASSVGEKNYLISRSNTELVSDAKNEPLWNINPKHFGFNVIKDENDNPLALWHHAPIKDNAFQKPRCNESFLTTQCFWVPDYKNLDPVITIDSFETLLNTNQIIDVHLISNNQVQDSKSITIDGNFSSKISKIFGYHVSGEYTIICDFWCNNFGYLHVHYNTQSNSGDQVHAHLTNWKVTDEKQLIPTPIKGRGLARKFLHIPSDFESNHSYLIVHTNKILDLNEPKLKVRVITDSGSEELVTINILNESPMLVISLRKLFPHLNNISNNVAIIQIESSDDNYDASIVNYNLASGSVSVDHLTGG